MGSDLKNLSFAGPVCVTGASGFIASWIVKYLVEGGADVRGTVRDTSNDKKVGHLHRIAEQGPGTLELFEADLTNPGSFDEAVDGCSVVIHTASPFLLGKIDDPEAQLVKPAKEGTRTVLDAVNKSPSVARVVLTSSVVAIYGDNCEIEQAKVFDEQRWNETSSAEHQPYSYSKTIAEREAWSMHDDQDRWTMATVNPAFVIGPGLADRFDSASLATLKQMADGTMRFGAPDLSLGWVDVRDVAQAHIRAALQPELVGRHIMCAKVMTFVEAGKRLRAIFGDKYPFPSKPLPKFMVYLIGPTQGMSWEYLGKNLGYRLAFDTTRAKDELGQSFRPIDETFKDALEQVESAGHLG